MKDILTMQLGLAAVLLAARVQFDDDLRAVEVELVASDIEDTLRERLPDIVQMFLDPSRVNSDDLVAIGEHVADNLADLTALNRPDGIAALNLPSRLNAGRTRPGRRLRSRPRTR